MVFGLALGIFDLTMPGISSAILFAFLVAVCTKPNHNEEPIFDLNANLDFENEKVTVNYVSVFAQMI